ncbi:hypothetical protein E2C01_005112 [Portunus trituberculatus]|uniref:Uncharacterized protein n=1 Tax=Portunus trituberculatus TaxID=210409 RepID=A0A5B7CS98_PORTR|nr:hypothetical protein [Portunus trituberculatus]
MCKIVNCMEKIVRQDLVSLTEDDRQTRGHSKIMKRWWRL